MAQADISAFSRLSSPAWLNEAVFYQIYPQSFFDTNGDGIGDIPGLIQKLDYLQWLGVNALWINPCFVSPFQDAGYDVADYYRLAPRYGTNRDLYRLCREARRRGIRICLDLVAGHTSNRHPWFLASSRSRKNRNAGRYVWTPPDARPFEQRYSLIQGDYARDESYVANCFDFQPALNYGFAEPDQPWQQPVDAPGPLANRRELLNIMDFWLGHGVDGFRVDMAFSLVKRDPGCRKTIQLWQDISRTIRARYPESVLISEWGNPEESIAAGFDIDFLLHFGVAGYPDLMLNEHCFFRRKGGSGIQGFLTPYLEQVRKTNGKGLISIPTANHDFKRPRSDGRTFSDLKVLYTFLLTWPGVPFIYYGDEIGMRYIPELPSKEGGYDRTGSRTPFQWDDSPNAGFSTADAGQFYLPLDPHHNRPSVEKQARAGSSLLNHVRRLIALRKSIAALQSSAALVPVPPRDGERHFSFLRQSGDERFLISVNPASEPAEAVIQDMAPGQCSPVLCHGVQSAVDGATIRLKMAGVSYGVFRL